MAKPDMGLAPGGRMKQEIYDDPYGLDAWDQRHYSRCFVTIANSIAWARIYDCAGAREALLMFCWPKSPTPAEVFYRDGHCPIRCNTSSRVRGSLRCSNT